MQYRGLVASSVAGSAQAKPVSLSLATAPSYCETVTHYFTAAVAITSFSLKVEYLSLMPSKRCFEH